MNAKPKEMSRLHTERGFTLIEVLISVAILAAAMMSVFTIYTQCIVEIRRAKNRTMATNAAQMMMEMIASSPHAVLSYHGLATTTDPPAGNPARNDLLVWKSALQAFPTSAIGTISVVDELYSNVVTVQVSYDAYGKNTTNTLSLKIRKRP
jgi:prepilin-type N-terminal cleavage/methylation domain-containing protein